MKKILLTTLIIIFPFLIYAQENKGDYFLNKANTLFKKERYNDSLLYYRKALVNNANKALVYYNMANVYYLLKKPWKSIIYYKKVTEILKEISDAINKKGVDDIMNTPKKKKKNRGN